MGALNASKVPVTRRSECDRKWEQPLQT